MVLVEAIFNYFKYIDQDMSYLCGIQSGQITYRYMLLAGLQAHVLFAKLNELAGWLAQMHGLAQIHGLLLLPTHATRETGIHVLV